MKNHQRMIEETVYILHRLRPGSVRALLSHARRLLEREQNFRD